jgi:translation elongation factor P/translation initiation factor 5A
MLSAGLVMKHKAKYLEVVEIAAADFAKAGRSYRIKICRTKTGVEYEIEVFPRGR